MIRIVVRNHKMVPDREANRTTMHALSERRRQQPIPMRANQIRVEVTLERGEGMCT
jgi:hypothetical protein